MKRQAAAREKRLGIGERPAPAIEADHALKLRNRLLPECVAVETRLAEQQETFTGAPQRPQGRHRTKHTPVPIGTKDPRFLGLRPAGP